MKGKFTFNRGFGDWVLNLVLVGCFFSLTSVVQAGGDVSLIKTVQKSFRLNSSVALSIKNKYGKIHVNTWSKSHIGIEISIVAHGPTESIAQQRMDAVAIGESRDDKRLQLYTQTYAPKSGSVKLGNKGVSVSYEISIPSHHPLEIENKFGDIYIEDRTGSVKVFQDNGNLVLGRLEAPDNHIKVSFGVTTINYIDGGKVDVNYGSLVIDEAKDITLKAEGTNIKIDHIDDLDLHANLGNVEINRAKEVSGKYSSALFYVDFLEKKLDMDIKYAKKFEIEDVGDEFQGIRLDAYYCSINLPFAEEASFNLEANIKYGTFRYEAETVSMTIIEDKDAEKTIYLGRFGKKRAPAAKVLIESEYGHIKVGA